MLNISGTTPAGTPATLYDPQGQSYRGFSVKNNDPVGTLWINENGNASTLQPSLQIRPNEEYITPENAPIFTETLSIVCLTAAAYTARIW